VDPIGDTQEDGENYIMRNSIICILHQILLVSSNQGEWGGQDMESKEMPTQF
jgi:hypothetical protein